MASTLHAVALGNVLPAETRMVVVYLNPSSLTKLMDQGSFQTVGIVSELGLFMRQLVETIREEC